MLASTFAAPLAVVRRWVEKDVLDETAVVTCGAVIKVGYD